MKSKGLKLSNQLSNQKVAVIKPKSRMLLLINTDTGEDTEFFIIISRVYHIFDDAARQAYKTVGLEVGDKVLNNEICH